MKTPLVWFGLFACLIMVAGTAHASAGVRCELTATVSSIEELGILDDAVGLSPLQNTEPYEYLRNLKPYQYLGHFRIIASKALDGTGSVPCPWGDHRIMLKNKNHVTVGETITIVYEYRSDRPGSSVTYRILPRSAEKLDYTAKSLQEFAGSWVCVAINGQPLPTDAKRCRMTIAADGFGMLRGNGGRNAFEARYEGDCNHLRISLITRTEAVSPPLELRFFAALEEARSAVGKEKDGRELSLRDKDGAEILLFRRQ